MKQNQLFEAERALSTFSHDLFGEIRIADQNGEPWFVAKDICQSLGFKNPSDATKYLDNDERTLISNPSGNGGSQTTIINESGLYSLILRSRKPEAKKFKKWVTSEVLPSIRKTGGYQTPQFDLPTSFAEALRTLADTTEQNEALTLEVKEIKPKAEFYDRVVESNTVCQMAVAAQVVKLPFGRNTLFMKLRKDGALMSEGQRHNLPKQNFVERGLFTVQESSYTNEKTQETKINFTTYVTQKGIDWLIKCYGSGTSGAEPKVGKTQNQSA